MDKTKETAQGYIGFLDDGTLPMISVPVCLLGFCETGKSSLCNLLTGVKNSPVTNSTKVASAFSITPCRTKYSIQWRLRNREKNANTLAAALTFADSVKDAPSSVIGETPFKILGFKSLDLSLSSSVTKLSKKAQANQANPPPKRIPDDVAKILKDPQNLCTNFNSNPEVILQVLDCGGHPMYLETIPLLVGPRCIYCIVYNLLWKLDDRAVIKFWKNSGLLQQKVSSKTYLDHVVEWISIIDCQFSRDHDTKDQPTALFIGTHFDLFVKERFNNDRMEARIAANDIFERVKAAIQDKLYRCKLHLKVYYVDNTTAGTSEEDVAAAALRSLIEETAREYSTLAMPISWLCMLHHLRYYNNKYKPYVHITEVKEAAAMCGVRRKELQACLQMFHRLSMLFYFDNIEELKGYVFIDVNWFLKELGKIFVVPCVNHYENEWKHLHRTGIVTNRLQSYLFESEFIKGWSLRVLSFLGLAGCVESGNNTAIIPNIFFASDQVNSKAAFSLPFFPSMIEATANSPPRKEYLTFPNGEVLSPLFFVLSPNDSAQHGLVQYLPPGFLTHVISKLTESDSFSIVLDARDQPSTPSFSNQFTFSCGKLKIDNITIRGHSNCIQITVERKSRENHQEFTPPSEICAAAYEEIYSTCQLILLQWMPKITIHPCFFCRDCAIADHFAILHDIALNPPTLNCTKSTMVYSAVQPEMLWFKQSSR